MSPERALAPPTLLLAAMLAACGGSSPPAKPPAPVEPTPVVPPVGTPPEEDPEGEEVPPRTREQAIIDALARVPGIRERVTGIRALPSKDVVAAAQTIEDFRTFVTSEYATEMPADKAAATSRALAHLGVLAEQVDLVATNIEAMVTQAAAYYDPRVDAFKVVQIPEDDATFDMISAHELTHAVQDQNFDLEKFMPSTLSDEAANARRFVVEGDATLIMLLYAVVAETGVDPLSAQILPSLRAQLDMFASLDPATIGAMMAGDPTAAAAAALPPYVIVPMFDSYMKGARMAFLRYLEGGWPAVDTLYSAPPSSTEQVLHPASKLICYREEPVAVKLPASTAGKGATPVAEGSLGELGLRVYAQVWSLPNVDAFAAGWGGDSWQVVEQNGALLGLLATAWDSAADATEFADGMRASFATRKVAADLRVVADRVDVVIGCEGKACQKALDAMGKVHKKTAKSKVAPARVAAAAETECLTRIGP